MLYVKTGTDLSGYIMKYLAYTDSTTMMTMYKVLIYSRLDFCSELWSPHFIKHIVQIEKVQRSLTKFKTQMCKCSYSDRLSL